MELPIGSAFVRDLLVGLGYHEEMIPKILDEIDALFIKVELPRMQHLIEADVEQKDGTLLINHLKELMVRLESEGYYRPDIPRPLLRLLVNGLVINNEDIFGIIDDARISDKKKKQERELLVSCASITQLGYILLRCLFEDVKVASSGSHVFLLINGFSRGFLIFIDFSLDSISEIDFHRLYRRENDYYRLINEVDAGPAGKDVYRSLAQYYSFFQLTSGIGLSHTIHNNLAIAYYSAKEYEKALDELNKALKLDPGYIEAHNNLGVLYNEMGRHEEAIKELKWVLGIEKDHIEARVNLGNVYAGTGRYNEAILELDTAIELEPGNASAHNSLGDIFAMQEHYDEAIKEFQEALKLDPHYAFAHNNLGHVYYELGRYDEAAEEFQEAIKLDPVLVEAHHGMGLAYHKLGRYDRAAHAWTWAVHLRPELMDSVPDILKLKITRGLSRLKMSSD